jgi:hypothetical protein
MPNEVLNEHYVEMLIAAAEHLTKQRRYSLKERRRNQQDLDLERIQRELRNATAFIMRGAKAGRRHKKLTEMAAKLAEMRIDRGAAPAEADVAREKLIEVRSELRTLPKPARPLPSHVSRAPARRGRRTSTGAKPTLRVAVTERALQQRINRALSRKGAPPDVRGWVLKIARTGSRYYLARGRTRRQDNVDIDTLARRLSALKPFEYLPGVLVGADPVKRLPEAGASWPSNWGAARIIETPG